MRNKFLIISILLLMAAPAFSQIDLYVVYIRGIVTEIETGEPIPYAHVINANSHSGTTTNSNGFFSIRMTTEDTLVIRAVGYVDFQFYVDHFPPKEQYDIKMKPIRFLIDEVTVTEKLNMRDRLGLPDAKPLDIPVELRGSAFNEKPPWYAALLTPISFAQYHTSKEEKQKREAIKSIKNNNEWLQFSKYHNLETIHRLTGLSETKADNFMLYCNINNRLPYFASQMEIEFQIMDFFFKWKREQAAKTELSE
ncbi:MAG TPA: carboxypeptidase-like regulatory domain-containing protein [Prolixibacteraceae bacterium]|nr:carboxypeptidase-like regulatory domain-containing protein [Prolixibacteraceae bacterium]